MASFEAVKPYTITVPTMTRNVAETSVCPASPMRNANSDATAAATIPRGASHAKNSRSDTASFDPRQDRNTAVGLATRIVTAMTTKRREKTPEEVMGILLGLR